MSWTVTGPVWAGKAVMRVDKQARKPACCWYGNVISKSRGIDCAGLRCLHRRFLIQTITEIPVLAGELCTAFLLALCAECSVWIAGFYFSIPVLEKFLYLII